MRVEIANEQRGLEKKHARRPHGRRPAKQGQDRDAEPADRREALNLVVRHGDNQQQ
jgi:hypothetical protein